MDDSSNSFAKLQSAMLGACEREQEWPAKLGAGICAGLEFVVADPDAARGLIAETQSTRARDSTYLELLTRLSALLGEIAPDDKRLPASTRDAVVGGIVMVVLGHLHRDRLDRLAALGPDLVYFALLPYLGFDEAQNWAQATTHLASDGP
jgi:hypothetical protein